MLNFFKKKNKNIANNSIDPVKIAALLIHAAKIDENYTDKEKEIIKKTLLKLEFKEENLNQLMNDAEKLENNSNQILDFTKEIKNVDEESKKKIFESLWNIIYSDEKSDIYEANLMRRLSGLLYLDPKIAGNIKEKVKLKLSK
tara:strand:+ start:242 stop:670 length:429 start_codon:yes stop_codon:yes gene_type:complete